MPSVMLLALWCPCSEENRVHIPYAKRHTYVTIYPLIGNLLNIRSTDNIVPHVPISLPFELRPYML